MSTPTSSVHLNLFQRAAQKLPLSPEERAFLKLVYLTIGSAALTGGVAAGQFILRNNHAVDWSAVLTVFLSAFGLTLYESGRKWVTAHSDGPLGPALQILSEAVKRANAPAPTKS